jgi:hypothetical protein
MMLWRRRLLTLSIYLEVFDQASWRHYMLFAKPSMGAQHYQPDGTGPFLALGRSSHQETSVTSGVSETMLSDPLVKVEVLMPAVGKKFCRLLITK